jgi:hypothetical protein
MSYRFVYIALGVALLVSVGQAGSTELDSLLSGFEDEQPANRGELDELLGGFSDPVPEEDFSANVGSGSSLPAWLTLQGSVSLQSTANFAHAAPPPGTPDYRGLSMFRGHTELISEATFSGWKARLGATAFYDAAYHLNGQRDLYTDTFLDEYEKEIRLEEAYLQGSLTDDLDLKIGRQIVVWGRSDNIRITDVLNPLDRRWPGMVDIRFLRLPVTMTKIDYFWQNWSVTPLLVHEPRFDIFPAYNGEFYPFPAPAPSLREPDWSWDSQQPALAVNGIFSGWDISFYAGYVYPEGAYLEAEPSGQTYRTRDQALMLGSAANVALGNWLLKAEAAWWDGLRYSTVDDEKSRLDILAGLEYTGFSEATVSFELANRHIIDYDPAMALLPDGQEENWSQYALRFVKDFNNDTLHLTVLVSSFGLLGADGGFERLQLDYDVTDNLTLTGGVVFYESGDHPGFREIGDNDRLLFELEYRF